MPDDGIGVYLLDDSIGVHRDLDRTMSLGGGHEHPCDRHGRGGLACLLRYLLYLRRRRVPARPPDLPGAALHVR
jgi:hypothetical protein